MLYDAAVSCPALRVSESAMASIKHAHAGGMSTALPLGPGSAIFSSSVRGEKAPEFHVFRGIPRRRLTPAPDGFLITALQVERLMDRWDPLISRWRHSGRG